MEPARHRENSSLNLDELLTLARTVVAEASQVAVRMRESDRVTVATKSTDTDVVTDADAAIEALMIDRLRAARPRDTFLGEESGSHGGSAPAGAVRWVMDPIDGTVNFLYRLPHFAVSLAAEVAGEVAVAVVRDAVTGHEWHAIRGAGAYRGDQRLAGSAQTQLRYALAATGFGYAPDRRAHQARVLVEVLPKVRDIRRYGAAAIDLCYAAQGLVDVYFEQGLNAWDHAAGGLIAREAGLMVAGLAGAAPSPAMVVAAPPALFGPLHDILVASDAAGGPPHAGDPGGP
jgi:myo-inositol-1(or 4)-monophosphatase